MFGTAAIRIRGVLQGATIALLTATAACEQATAPLANTPDANATLADYQALEQMFASDGFAGVQALAGRTPMSASATVAAMRALPGLASESSSRQYALDLFRAAAAQASRTSFAKTVISSRHLGRTLVYNVAKDQYVIDSARTGAPANGTRFIVYELNADGKPNVSREIGRADLIDEGAGTGEAIALRLLVVTRGSTTLDYRTRVDIGTTASSIDVSGFATDGTERLDFTVGLDGRKVATGTVLDADFEFSVKPRNFTVTGTVRGVQDGREGEGKVSFTAKHQENTLRVELNGTAGTVNGAINWNGKPYITITGPAATPTLRGPSGQPLTPDEVRMVQSVMRMSDDVFDLVEELVEPVEDIVILGWIL